MHQVCMYEGQQLRQKGSLVARRMPWHAWPRALGASRTFQNGAVGCTRFCSTHGGGPLCQQPAGPCTNGALSGTRLRSLSAHGGGPRRQLPADCGDPSSCPGAAGGTGPCRACRPTCGARRARTTSPMQRRGHAPRRRSADLITGLIRCRCAQASARPIGVGVRSMVWTSGDLLGGCA